LDARGRDYRVVHDKRSARVVVADPARDFRVGVRNLLERDGGFAVVESASLAETVVAVREAPADIVLLDVDLPPAGAVSAVEQLARVCDSYIVVWSFEPSREEVLRAVRLGAHGYLHKEISPGGLVRALRGVALGEAPISRDLATLMIDALHGLDERRRARDQFAKLSSREREVIDLVAQGARNKEIAAVLAISEFTAKRHVQNILQKLELPSRRAAAAFYLTALGGAETSHAAGQRA
jgi:DNA-binding NarL/FixJ family response regulator